MAGTVVVFVWLVPAPPSFRRGQPRRVSTIRQGAGTAPHFGVFPRMSLVAGLRTLSTEREAPTEALTTCSIRPSAGTEVLEKRKAGKSGSSCVVDL